MAAEPFNHSTELRRLLVKRHGPLGGRLEMARLMLWNLICRLKFGAHRVHLLLSVAALANGSAHCAHANGYAFQLGHFRRRGSPFPLDEGEWTALLHSSGETLATQLDAALTAEGLTVEAGLVKRLLELKLNDEPPRDFTDRCLVGAIELMNAANVGCLASPQPFEDVVRGQAGLKSRYASARLGRPRSGQR